MISLSSWVSDTSQAFLELLQEWHRQEVNSRLVQGWCQNRHPCSWFGRFVRSAGVMLVMIRLNLLLFWGQLGLLSKCVRNRLLFLISGCLLLLVFCNVDKRKQPFFLCFGPIIFPMDSCSPFSITERLIHLLPYPPSHWPCQHPFVSTWTFMQQDFGSIHSSSHQLISQQVRLSTASKCVLNLRREIWIGNQLFYVKQLSGSCPQDIKVLVIT